MRGGERRALHDGGVGVRCAEHSKALAHEVRRAGRDFEASAVKPGLPCRCATVP
jgi:hypothetical protein